jgi:polyhydroxybutyrate depolymerase
MRPRLVIVIVLALIALPAILAAYEAGRWLIHNRTNGSLVSSGIEREYFVHVPRSYDGSRPVPLIISLHGAGGWPVQQMEMSRWNELAEHEGFIVLYPSAYTGRGMRIWRVGEGPELALDVGYIADLIDKITSEYKIDRNRIYANGLSNGGGMSFALSCTLADRIAAVGMVGAAQTLPWSWCRSAPVVPAIAFHGTEDPAVPYNGGVSWTSTRQFPSVPLWMSKWARRNGCADVPHDSRVAPAVTRREYTGCAGNADVVLYTIEGGGHTWPGGEPLPEYFVGRTSNAIDANREMWKFFQAHPLRGAIKGATPSS